MAFNIYEQDKFRAQLSWAWKKFYNLGLRTDIPSDLVWVQSSTDDKIRQLKIIKIEVYPQTN